MKTLQLAVIVHIKGKDTILKKFENSTDANKYINDTKKLHPDAKFDVITLTKEGE